MKKKDFAGGVISSYISNSKITIRMVLFLILLFLTLILHGCNTTTATGLDEKKLKWFKTQSEAIKYGVKEEQIEENDIIDELNSNGEIFLVYKTGNNVGLSNIAKNKGKYTWYRSDAYTAVTDTDTKISFLTETLSKKKFYFYVGKLKGTEITIKTNIGDVSPSVDKNTKLYYFISPK